MMYIVFLLVLLVLIYAVELGTFATIHYDNGGVYDNNMDGLGNYNYKLILPEQQREEEGAVDTSTANEGNYVVRGNYSFNSGGQIYKVSYIADSNGYRAHVQQDSEVTTPAVPFLGAVDEKGINKHALDSIGGSRSGK